jgi:thioredoxin-related protein
MKKILLFALTAFMAAGCYDHNDDDDYNVITIDSCEYITSKHNTIGIIHKQNCKFCEKRNKQETEELIKKLKEM